MKPLHIACSPLTNTIYAGHVDKAGTAWSSQQDVTGAACGAVANHVIARGGKVVVHRNGEPWVEISAREVK